MNTFESDLAFSAVDLSQYAAAVGREIHETHRAHEEQFLDAMHAIEALPVTELADSYGEDIGELHGRLEALKNPQPQVPDIHFPPDSFTTYLFGLV